MFVLFSLLVVSLEMKGQVNVAASNLLRYGVGKEVVGPVTLRRDYVENLTETKISFHDFLVGFRLLFDAPPEYGVEFRGIRKRYLEFRKDNLYIRAGDSFSLFGRGLALNLFENRALAFDTGIDGIKMEYTTEFAKFRITGGDVAYVDVLNLSRVEHYRLRAGSVEITPLSMISLGMSFVSGKYEPPANVFPYQPAQFNIPELFGQVRLTDIDLYAAYIEKRTSLTLPGDRTGTHKGTAFYGSASYVGEAFGVSFEYKDYRLGIMEPRERGNVSYAKRAYAFQNAPIVHKEHSFTLLTRYPHVVNLNDEVGYQVDVFYTLFGKLAGSINGAVASRHYIYTPLDPSQPFTTAYGTAGRKGSFLPKLDSRYSPFWEIYTELQYYFREGETDYVLIGFNRRSDEVVDENIVPPSTAPKVDATRTTAVPISVQYSLLPDWTLKLTSERQWVFEGKNSVEPRYYTQLFTLGISRSPIFAVAIRYEFTTDKGTVDGRKDWGAVDVNYRLSARHTVTLTAGGDRGGQVCANGVCRFVNPFLGVRASVISYL